MESERCSEIFQIRIVNSRAGSGPGVISTQNLELAHSIVLIASKASKQSRTTP